MTNFIKIAVLFILIGWGGQSYGQSLEASDDLKMNQLNVPDGFSYKTTRSIDINLSIPDLEESNVIYQILGVDMADNTDLISQNFIPIDGNIKTQVKLPLHFKGIIVKIERDNAVYMYEWAANKSIEEVVFLEGASSN